MAKQAPQWRVQWFGTSGSQAQIIVWLIKERQPNASQGRPFDRDLQVGQGRHTQNHQIAGLFRPLKAPSCFQAGVSNLDDLLRQRNIGSDQHIGVDGNWLPLRHGYSYHFLSLPILKRVRGKPQMGNLFP